MPGCISPNFHEGYRSEYLAQFVFSAWGTAVPTHEQDYGVDLLCSLVQRECHRAWARSPYTVQVKSTMEPWIFDGDLAVRWLIEHPSPIFLCVIDKATLHVRVYQISQRFYVWGLPQRPCRLELVPTTDQRGGSPQWPVGETQFSLGAPILDFGMCEFAKPECRAIMGQSLTTWIDIEERNLALSRHNIPQFVMPLKYTPNQPPNMRMSASYKRLTTPAADRDFQQMSESLRDALGNICRELLKRSDLCGAAISGMLHRHLFPDRIFTFESDIDNQIALAPDQYRHVGFEYLEQFVQRTIEEAQRNRDKSQEK